MPYKHLFASVIGITLAWTGCGGAAVNTNTATGSTAVIVPHTISSEQHLSFNGSSYSYWLYTPSAFDGSKQLPILLLLHGGGGQGLDMIHLWQAFADQQGTILLAPTLPYSAALEATVPRLFPALLDAVKPAWRYDSHRAYVFGYSAGGYLSYDAATLVSERFAAAGVFAAIITPEYESIVSGSGRKTPVAIYIGDHDQFFTLTQTRATRDLLLAHGYPVHYTEYSNQDHNYPAISAQVNSDFWTYASQFSLP